MPTARSLMAALALAFTAVSCSDDQAPTGPDTKNTAEAPSAAITQSPQQLVFSVTGQQTDGGTFTGTARITEITRVGNQLFATGVLNGVSTTIGAVTNLVFTTALDITQAGRTCRILELDLGPIDLNLLGLRVQLSEVELDITAIAGPGNLLGNLLCALVGLLDSGSFAAIDRLLDQINAIIGAL